jgi:hypothetical protein|tara:strand:+ start:1210 stop:1911 length:702 start_codon:yes stop_codon:yes gene_type:complete
MSEIKVDTVGPRVDNGTLTIGAAGDTVNIAGTAGTGFPTPTTGIAASAITTGTMATARLGSGTASSSTFLRGDQTYAAPTASVFGSSYFAAFNNTDQTLTNATYTKITVNTEIVDSGGNFDTSNNRFIAPATGIYFIYVRGYADSGTNTEINSVLFGLKKNNGTIVAESSLNMAANPGRNMGPALQSTISLSASDYIEFWCNANDASGSPVFKSNTIFSSTGAGNEFGGWRVA